MKATNNPPAAKPAAPEARPPVRCYVQMRVAGQDRAAWTASYPSACDGVIDALNRAGDLPASVSLRVMP